MSKNRLPPDMLWKLRNLIPIDHVILDILKLDIYRSDGCLRFQCPLCNGHHTATNSKTNLARCFDCRENFNPIDMAMKALHLEFLDAVKLLSKHIAI